MYKNIPKNLWLQTKNYDTPTNSDNNLSISSNAFLEQEY